MTVCETSRSTLSMISALTLQLGVPVTNDVRSRCRIAGIRRAVKVKLAELAFNGKLLRPHHTNGIAKVLLKISITVKGTTMWQVCLPGLRR